MPHKSSARIVVLLVVLIAAAGIGWIYWQVTAEKRNAGRIIRAIAAYQDRHGYLPDPKNHAVMKSLGFELRVGWHPDYQRRRGGQYCLTILKGFDGPYWVYDSASKAWCRGYPRAAGENCARCISG